MTNPFEELLNNQLSSVIFIQDYVQLDFDGHRLTCYKWPNAYTSNGQLSVGHINYRNELCSFIGIDVVNTDYDADTALILRFANGGKIELPFEVGDNEVLYYRSAEGEWFAK